MRPTLTARRSVSALTSRSSCAGARLGVGSGDHGVRSRRGRSRAACSGDSAEVRGCRWRLLRSPTSGDALNRRGLGDQVLLLGVAIEAHDGRQATGDRGPGPALLLQPTGVELDVRPGHRKQVQVPLRAPLAEHANVQGVGLAGPPGIPGQESGHGDARRTEQRPDRDQLDSRHNSSPFSWEIHHPPSRRTAHDVPFASGLRAVASRVLERVFGASPRVSSTSGTPLGHLLMRVVGRRLFRRHATRAVDLGAMRGSGGVGAIVAVRQALAGRHREGLHWVIVPGVRQAPGLVSGYWAHERSVGESSFWSRSNRGKQPPPSLTTSGAMPQIRLLLGSSSKTFASSRYPPVHSTRTCRAWAR
jgi:hypothetical protein